MKEKLTLEEMRGAFHGATKKTRKPPQWKTVKCERCGEEISVLSKRTKYCPECAKAAKMEKNRESAQILKSLRAEEAGTAQRQRAKREGRLDEKIKAATQAGMSYGKYVAMKEAGMR